ncbi:hypothetical protein NHJ6243_008080 [Beauveria neobassiana]
MKKGKKSNCRSGLPLWRLAGKFVLRNYSIVVAEEHEEKHKSGYTSAVCNASIEIITSIHKTKAKPLPAELYNSKHSSCAFKRLDFFAAAHGGTRRGNSQNICESGSRRRSTEKHKIWRNALCCTSRYDSIMLWKIGDEKPEEDQSVVGKASARGSKRVMGSGKTTNIEMTTSRYLGVRKASQREAASSNKSMSAAEAIGRLDMQKRGVKGVEAAGLVDELYDAIWIRAARQQAAIEFGTRQAAGGNVSESEISVC